MTDQVPIPLNPAAIDSSLKETETLRPESTIFGGYEILSEIARGGMGVVYKARQLSLDRVVALKLVQSGSDASDGELRRFQVEAKAAARLDHPHIVPVYEIGEHEGQHFFSMGFVDGPSLSARLAQSGPLPPREAAEILRKMATAVDYAHRQGVIHRDLQPDNVLMTPSGEPKVTNFGLAKRLNSEQSLTATGQVIGTPAYMSPEQTQGDRSVIGPATDIYSLGATLFAALTGRPPFTSTVIHDLLIQITEEPPPSLRSLNANVPAALEAICLKCLAKSPADRYSSAGALAEDLGRFLDSDRVNVSRRRSAAKVGRWVTAVAVVLIAGVWFGRQVLVSQSPDVTGSPEVASATSPISQQVSAADEQLLRSLSIAQDALLPSPTGNLWEFRYADGAAACEQAFREFGFTLDQGTPSQLADSLKRRSPEFRESVLCGLELWELCAAAAKQMTIIEPLQQTQNALDTLAWRRSLRQARSDTDVWNLLQGVGDALTESPTPEQIEVLALLIGSRSPEKNPETLGVLRNLLQASPKNFLTNLVTASALHAITRTKSTEGAAYASESVVPLRAAAKARPASVLPQAQLVAVFTDLGNVEAATMERERLYQRQYPETWPLIVTARKTRENKQYDQAIALLRKALAKQADVPHGEFELAANLILKGQDEDAEPLLQKLAKSAVDDGAAYQALQEVFWIVEQPSSESDKPSRDLAAKKPLSARVWRAFIKYRRSQGADAPTMAIAPFDAEQAKQHQEAWAKHLGVPVEYTNSIGMKFRLIPPGQFLMGSPPQEIEEALTALGGLRDGETVLSDYWRGRITSGAPQHTVILTQPIYLGVHEVTQAEYEKVMGVNPSHFTSTGGGKDAVTGIETANFPVEQVNWNDAAEFCAKLSQQEKLKPFYFREGETIMPLDGKGYRLPSEAEWEFACRAGTTTKYWISDKDEDLVQVAWFSANADSRTHAVGGLKANPFGFLDMHSNVWEWLQDGWDPNSYRGFENKATIDPRILGTAYTERMARGGSLAYLASACRSSFRHATAPTRHFPELGFRVALLVDSVKTTTAERTIKPVSDLIAGAPPPAIAPFNAEEARQHQAAWAKSLGVPVEYTNSIGMKFRLIPPGEFMMGGSPIEIEEAIKNAGDYVQWPENMRRLWQEDIKSEAPQHKVILTQPIYLGVFEVTQAQYQLVMGTNPSYFSPTSGGKGVVSGMDTTSHPVETVEWSDVSEFCAKLSQQEKLKPLSSRIGETVASQDGAAYRLPTEAEWEFACRAGTTTKYWIGDTDDDLRLAGWFSGAGRTHKVGELKPNPFGLYDIHGNVQEWVQDWWGPAYYGQFLERPAINPNGPSHFSSQRVFRGGNWELPASFCRTAHRPAHDPGLHFRDLGFRVALMVDAVKAAISNRPTNSNNP